MKIPCPKCGTELEYGSKPPAFCSQCGSALDSVHLAETLPPEENGRGQPGISVEEGDTIGNYRLVRHLGAGGMGKVFEAEDLTSGRRVAVKLLSAHSADSAETVERFRREGRLASALTHPRCVFVVAADEDKGVPYIVMELMPGRTLEDLINEKGRLSADEAIDIIIDVIEGLEQAHKLGIIHRDVKPSNCFLDEDDRAKVGDFGLSKSLTKSARLTQTGSFLGTPLFASPEQIKGDPVHSQTDVYSVAATLYYMLSGKPPILGSDAAATLARIVADPPDRLRKHVADVDPILEKVVMRGLEKSPARRWRNLEEFKRALKRCQISELSAGGLGLRFAAYIVDALFLMLLAAPFQILAVQMILGRANQTGKPTGFEIVGAIMGIVYWGVLEGIFGFSLGKYFLQLRVCNVGNSAPPGLARGLLRATVFNGLIGLGTIAWILGVMLWFPPDKSIIQIQQEQPLVYMAVSMMPLTLLILGLVLIFFPMLLPLVFSRIPNNFRCMHEWLSGTRTVQLPSFREKRAFAELPFHLTQPADCPAKIGPYAVKGALHWSDASKFLLGQDESLERQVWLWLRPLSEPPLSSERRELARTGRQRWLAHGRDEGWQWDAFVATPGCTLPDLVEHKGTLTWTDFQPILEQLTEELEESADENSIPDVLTPEQVWVQPDGNVQLMDFYKAEPESSPETETSFTNAENVPSAGKTTPQNEQRRFSAGEPRALFFLRQTCQLSLEGKLDEVDQLRRLQAPLPSYAVEIVDNLVGPGPMYPKLSFLHKALDATRHRPTEVSRLRRLAHLALQSALLYFGGLGAMICFPFIVAVMQDMFFMIGDMNGKMETARLVATADKNFETAMAHPNPLARLAAGVQWQTDRQWLEKVKIDWENKQERRRKEWRNTRDPVTRSFLDSFGKIMQESMDMQMEMMKASAARPIQSKNWRRQVDERLAPPKGMADVFQVILLVYAGMFIMAPAVLWIIWAFITRGGFSLYITGIALVRRDGRPALRLQCAWRAFLVWAPIVSLMSLYAWLDIVYLSAFSTTHYDPWMPVISNLCWLAAVVMLFGYVALALWRPKRTIHDVLSGTHLVPR